MKNYNLGPHVAFNCYYDIIIQLSLVVHCAKSCFVNYLSKYDTVFEMQGGNLTLDLIKVLNKKLQ